MKITKDTTIAQVMEHYPQSAQVFDALNIDSESKQQTIEEYCKQANNNTEAVVDMLNDLFAEESCGNCENCGCAS